MHDIDGNNELAALYDRWVTAFRDVPAILDAELMRAVLADLDTPSAGQPS